MIRFTHLPRKLPAVAGMLALTALLSGCLLSSVELLVSDDEAATPFPAKTVLHGYNEDPAGYVLNKEAPVALTLNGKTYVSDDGELAVRLVPLADEADSFLVAASGDDGSIYGVAHYAQSVLELKIVLGDNVDEAVAASGLSGLVVEEGGIVVTSRADLDAAVALIRGGQIEAGSIVYFVADDPGATPPTLIVRDGTRLKPGG